MTLEPNVSLVIPVYQSAAVLPLLYQRINDTMSSMEEDFELILVDDGSTDDGWVAMQELRSQDQRVRIVRLTRNFGQHNALMCGLSFARGQYILTLDDDLQNPPEEIPKLTQAMDQANADVIFGIPKQRQQNFLRKTGSALFSKILSVGYHQRGKLKISNVVLMRKTALESILDVRSINPVVGLLLLEATDRIEMVAIEHHHPQQEKTRYSFVRLLNTFTNGIMYHSSLPLKGVLFLGLACFGISITLGMLYLILYVCGSLTVPGWTTLVLLILLFSGINMISLGIIGEYLYRILQETRGATPYIIREKDV